MMREAGPDDRDVVEALLLRHVEGAMFPLSNLRKHGLGQGAFVSGHPRAMRVWFVGGDAGVLAVTQAGMLKRVLPQPAALDHASATMAGLTLTGAVGPAGQVRQVLRTLGLAAKETLIDRDEPGFALDLQSLQVPEMARAALIPADSDHRKLLVRWRTAYHRETLGTPEHEAASKAASDVKSYTMHGSHRILTVEGEPVAMTGFNASLPEIVQIGGVFTPTHLRNGGYARLALALHLAEAREAGVRRAVLFAASGPAARAYRAIGFQPAAPVALVLFDGPQVVAA